MEFEDETFRSITQLTIENIESLLEVLKNIQPIDPLMFADPFKNESSTKVIVDDFDKSDQPVRVEEVEEFFTYLDDLMKPFVSSKPARKLKPQKAVPKRVDAWHTNTTQICCPPNINSTFASCSSRYFSQTMVETADSTESEWNSSTNSNLINELNELNSFKIAYKDVHKNISNDQEIFQTFIFEIDRLNGFLNEAGKLIKTKVHSSDNKCQSLNELNKLLESTLEVLCDLNVIGEHKNLYNIEELVPMILPLSENLSILLNQMS